MHFFGYRGIFLAQHPAKHLLGVFWKVGAKYSGLRQVLVTNFFAGFVSCIVQDYLPDDTEITADDAECLFVYGFVFDVETFRFKACFFEKSSRAWIRRVCSQRHWEQMEGPLFR